MLKSALKKHLAILFNKNTNDSCLNKWSSLFNADLSMCVRFFVWKQRAYMRIDRCYFLLKWNSDKVFFLVLFARIDRCYFSLEILLFSAKCKMFLFCGNTIEIVVNLELACCCSFTRFTLNTDSFFQSWYKALKKSMQQGKLCQPWKMLKLEIFNLSLPWLHGLFSGLHAVTL